MHRETEDIQRGTTGESKWKSLVLGGIVAVGFLASLLYINGFASIEESIALGFLAALIGAALGRVLRKRKTLE